MKPKYGLARHLRRASTLPEHLLWERLKTRGIGNPVFRRQQAFGPYILDFYCYRAKLVVEIDGSDHHSNEAQKRDAQRDEWLAEQGLQVYRIEAFNVLRDPDGVAEDVIQVALARFGA
ncbi:endonuclease domain-containing protein [Asticcacaulis sp. AC460]|uniref:endonuclease domain-containing protein n=1 Tax=Asticcacaulis sp. AC460 TaxID=1282360 RepID=UPI0004CEB392|nr:endonuclease domain-containing protein [Asticcacaulis sp. AC460]